MQLERVIRLVIALCWQTVSMPACIVALAVPTICMESSAMLQVVIALDRFFHVFFPFWCVSININKIK
jgi:hypothetical protein